MFESITPLFIMIIFVVAITFIFLFFVQRAKVSELYKEDFVKLHNTLGELTEGMDELRTKVAAIEKLLREVE